MPAISSTSSTNHAVTEYSNNLTEQSQGVQNVGSISYASTQSGAGTTFEGTDFATVFSNAVVDEQSQFSDTVCTSGAYGTNCASTMLGMSMTPNAMSNAMTGAMQGAGVMPGMEQTLMDAVSNADSTNDQMAQIMMMMMMMMMQSGSGGGGDMSMFPMMISSLISQLDNSNQNSNRNFNQNFNHNPQMGIPFNSPMNMSPMNVPTVNGIFGVETNNSGNGMMTSSAQGFGSAILPLNVSMAATPVITSNVHNRSPERLRALIDQFQVETAERYRPGRDGFTYCNIFVLDVVRAMGAHIPHLGAINMCNWLGTTGRQYGWREVDPATAQAYANMGRPAVTSAGRIGHVQMVVPSMTPFNPERGVSIAQAGRINTNYAPISTIYRGNTLHTRIRYFVHD